jgi:hypothetical protein
MAEHLMTAPGRNDPCPCGSGRKFKHCCAERRAAEDAARLRIRNAEGRVVDALFKYALDQWGKAFFYEAWEEFFTWEDVPEDIPGTREFDPMFVPWFVLGYEPDPHTDRFKPDWPTTTVGLHWLQAEKPDLSEFERAYVITACASPMSASVVEAVEPGRSVDLKDILTGRRFHVLELSASTTFQPGDVAFTRVVTMGDTSVMFGLAPFRIPASWHLRIIDWRERAVKKRLMTRHDLAEYDIEIRILYFEIADKLFNPTLPTLANTDGDPLELTTLTYALKAPVYEVVERLRPLSTVAGEAHIEEDEADVPGAPASTTISWMKAGNKKHKDWTNTVLGTIRVVSGEMVAEVNSARRAARLRKEIVKRLGERAVLVKTEVHDMADALPERKQQRAAGTLVEEPEPAPTAEMLAFQDEAIRRHLESWVDMRLPALGNRTPRQAARTPRGRERLEALLADFEQKADDGGPTGREHLMDVRRTLGMEK